MKPIGIAYIVIGALAVLGALAAGYVAITLGQALGAINSADASQLPSGTDVAALQQSTASLNTLLTLSWVWIVAVILAGAISVHRGLALLKIKK